MGHVELCHDTIRFPFDHLGVRLEVRIRRTCAVPVDSVSHAAVRVLNRLPIRAVDDYALVGEVMRRGGVLVPMAAADACRIELRALGGPIAVRIGAGKINVLNGERWDDRAPLRPGEHLCVCVSAGVAVDGFVAPCGAVEQFVAHPMGFGSTVEEQVTGSAVWAGLQIQAIPLKKMAFDLHRREIWGEVMHAIPAFAPNDIVPEPLFHGFGRGGRTEPRLLLDTFESDAWDVSLAARCFVTLMDHPAFEALTGELIDRSSAPDLPLIPSASDSVGRPLKVTNALMSHLQRIAKATKD